jgi:hypothetical protein
MFGIRFIKVQPTMYLIQYKRGKIVREGSGISFFYYAPRTSLVAVPLASMEAPFIFSEHTVDFQEVTVQGQITYRVADPGRVSQLLNFAIDTSTHQHESEDPERLSQRLINLVNVLTRNELQTLSLREALRASDALVRLLTERLQASGEVTALGIEIMGFSILAIRPNPETGRALEAEAREQLLKEADEAIYARRNSAVEQERAIRENELNTELAVENKKKEIREAQMDAELAVREKQHQLKRADMEVKIALEERNKEYVALAAENTKGQADAGAYGIAAMMKALERTDPRIVQALASVGMQPSQLLALAFQGLADKAEKIGQLNVSPDLLRELMNLKAKE